MRELREQAVLSQSDLAEKAGVSKTTIIKIEQGKISPHPTTIRKLAAALGVEASDLMRRLKKSE